MKRISTWFNIGSCALLLAVILCACAPEVLTPQVTLPHSTPIGTERVETVAPKTEAVIPEPTQSYPGPIGAYPGPTGVYPGPDTSVTSPAYPAYPPPGESGSPYAPQPGDPSLKHGNVFIDSQEVVVKESYPPQFSLALEGSLPTPCHQLRVEVAPPDSDHHIEVTAYSVVDPGVICAQVLQSFSASIPLENLPAGKYTVSVNGASAGEIEVP